MKAQIIVKYNAYNYINMPGHDYMTKLTPDSLPQYLGCLP